MAKGTIPFIAMENRFVRQAIIADLNLQQVKMQLIWKHETMK
jgi:hypothetical protein